MPNVTVPAESGPHDSTVVCWPARDELWGDLRARAVEEYLGVIDAVSRFEPVTVIASPRHAEEARVRCDGLGLTGMARFDDDVVELPIDDSWARDSGPIHAVGPDGARVVIDVAFNGWGNRFTPFDDDAELARRWARHSATPVWSVRTQGTDDSEHPFVLEGGAVSVDGCGTVVTTEQCLLHPNRNPTLSRTDVEQALHGALGTTTVLWLPYGLALDRDTDGHVDNVAAFIAAGTLLFQGCDDPDEADHVRLTVDRRALEGAIDARGEPVEVVEVPVLPFTEVAGRRVAVPYLNLYLCNGGAIVPVSGHAADDEMLGLIASHLPGREVVGVPATALAYGGGGPHCITQQVPHVPTLDVMTGREAVGP